MILQYAFQVLIMYALCTLLPQRLLAFSYSKCREITIPVLSDNNGPVIDIGLFVFHCTDHKSFMEAGGDLKEQT